MTSNIDFSRNDTIMTMDLDVISFSGLSPGESLSLAFSVAFGQITADSWTATYIADSAGTVRLSALGRMWNRYLIAYQDRIRRNNTPYIAPDLLDVTITYTMENDTTATCHRYLTYSRRRLVHQFGYLPFLSKKKHTFADAEEPVTVLSSNVNLTVIATYVRNGVQETSNVIQLQWTDYSLGGRAAYVSPTVIYNNLPSGAKLMEYTVRMLSSGTGTVVDSCTYIVDQQNTLRTQMIWLNRWGVYETLSMMGTQTLAPERTAEFGWCGDDWMGLDMEVADEYECSTGYVGDNEWNQVRDLAESPIVWLWNGLAWHRVTITGVRLSRIKPTNEAPACIVRYRLSDREAEWF